MFSLIASSQQAPHSQHLLRRHECFTCKYTAQETHTKPHLGPEWHINFTYNGMWVLSIIVYNIMKRKVHGGLQIKKHYFSHSLHLLLQNIVFTTRTWNSCSFIISLKPCNMYLCCFIAWTAWQAASTAVWTWKLASFPAVKYYAQCNLVETFLLLIHTLHCPKC